MKKYAAWTLIITFTSIANDLPQGIKKINNDLYVGKKEDIYFALERITDKTNIFWEKFANNQLEKAQQKQKDQNNLIEKIVQSDEYKDYKKAEEKIIQKLAHQAKIAFQEQEEKFKKVEKTYHLVKDISHEIREKLTDNVMYLKNRVLEEARATQQAYDRYSYLKNELTKPSHLRDTYDVPHQFENIQKQWEKAEEDLITITTIVETIRSFLHALTYYKENEVWVAYASIKEILAPSTIMKLDYEHAVEMLFTVATASNIPFSTHMGIFRTLEFQTIKHKGLSINLHAFAAQIILAIYDNKKLMITRPLPRMREILAKQLPPEAIWIDKKPLIFEHYKEGEKITFKPFGKTITFKVPAFLTQPYLADDTSIPMIAIELPALGKLLTLDAKAQ